MNAEQFMLVIKQVVRDAAIQDAISLLERPPGRRPPQAELARAEWYKSLSPLDRKNLTAVVADAVDAALFGLFAVIDGVRTVENGEIKGTFELHYVKGSRITLNGPDEEMLHDLYMAARERP
jgi:hypothetical protein